MRKLILILFCTLTFSCTESKKNELSEGVWLFELDVMDNEKLPFNFKLTKSASGIYTGEIYNAEEVITVDEIEIINDSISIKPPVFQGYLAGKFTAEQIEGQFIKEDLDRIVPFKAHFGIEDRFRNSKASIADVNGIWEVEFDIESEDKYPAKGIFEQKENRVSGTFRTNTGDYRFLEGTVSGDSLKLSAFDGAHAFLFTAKVSDSTMLGAFYSGNHSKEIFTAKRNETYELADADSLTFLNEGYEKLAFSFPDVDGNMISLEDEKFKGKVVLVQVMGTWCPNCLDESKYYVDYLKNNLDSDLEIVALAFEYAKTEAGAFKSIARLKERIGINYPILLAQWGTSDKEEAQKKLPMLNHVLSYPTTIFIDRNGAVRKIHTGFNGPATGAKHEDFKMEFNGFVQKLLAEDSK